jgi:hypothetical protein
MQNKKLSGFILLCFISCLIRCGDSNHSGSNNPEFAFWTVGSGDINDRFGTNTYQVLDSLRKNTGLLDEFLSTIAEKPLTKNQIRAKSGLTRSQVDFIITRLNESNFIKKVNRDQWATTIPVVTDNQMKKIRKDLTPMADSVARYISNEAYRIRSLYDQVKLSRDPSWENVSHLIISKLIIDGTFHSNLNRLKRKSKAGEHDTREESVMPAFLLQKGGNNLNFGCNWYKFNEAEDQREIFVLHGAVLNRFHIDMEKHRRDQEFSAGLFKISPEGGLDSLTNSEKEMLLKLGWISGDRLLVPIVEAGTIKRLFPEMENIGKDAAEVAFAGFEDITDSYNRSTYSEFLDYDEDYIQVLIHSLFGLTIEHLVRMGTVSGIPETVPESFCVYFVFGKLY